MQAGRVELKRSLKLSHLILMGLAYMTPMVVFDTFGIVSEMTNGHVPTAYILALAAMLLTAVSYKKMIQVYPTAGSAYTYTQKSINPHLGFMVGWAALMDYLFLPMVNALIFQIYLSSIFPAVPEWIWIVGFVAVVTLLNLLSVNSTANFNTFLVIFQACIILLFIGMAVKYILNGGGASSAFSVRPFYQEGADMSLLIAGATLLCFSYLGFDAVAMLAEETPNPKKMIPRAIFLTALIGGIMFITASYFIQSVFPDVSAFKDPEASSPEIAASMGGAIFQFLFIAGGIAGTIASGISSHASVARLLYVMGRDRILPEKFFGYVHPKLRTPVLNIILVGGFSLTAVFFSLATATSFISFGALIAFTFVNLSVIAHYVFKKREHMSIKGSFTYIVMPLLGAATVAVLWVNLEQNSLILGISWSFVGFLYLVYLTRMFKKKPGNIEFSEMEELEPATLIENSKTMDV
ncbi:APC family permease [Domibacillus sp. DTU_2020_1001157_1_SI_ALB_TIR_016]|uniref:APC family permease n=1 Tax=Domibacillus sp. DTU_2020_1001157_1_SI_ALB_TIR_016 TaxID=3077789 RepID=UPI0028E2AAE1|nr:APC family permease [Domibacillus sp. DTU_2020_1001157_1_SI_ALB_TIR_016]WNS78526.1 APC family permease [Domibacillus sp. DTU_2020_1001157_1_SI_ALB_TIR_016]